MRVTRQHSHTQHKINIDQCFGATKVKLTGDRGSTRLDMDPELVRSELHRQFELARLAAGPVKYEGEGGVRRLL